MKENSLPAALQHYFGFSTFKGQQEAVITEVMQNNNCFVIMPTGGGNPVLSAPSTH